MDEATRLIAVQKILDDRDSAILERVELRKHLNEMLKKDRALEMKLSDLSSAGRVFGQVIAVPTDAKDFDSIEQVHKAMSKLRGSRPWEPGKSRPATPTPASDADVEPDATELNDPTLQAEGVRIRDHVLAYLKRAGATGAQASQIRSFLKDTLGISTHEKTVGMTLYRLSRESHVRRDGRTWFFVSPSVETKNPGGSPPGSTASRSK